MASETEFTRTQAIHKLVAEDTFGLDDTGITNPYSDAYVKLSRGGEVEIYAGNGTGIVLNPNSRSITFMGDCIKFITNDEDGLRWNEMSFNSQATEFTEPSLVPFEQDTRPSIFRDLDDYFEDD
jgi:hypothetical protein